ncbi:phage protease [Xenorhabdus nematophila]|uniref:phage protease n=2 Tax=Xenorhabdus nematophila TaxID=628 RepID=UPI0005440DB4|nr:phage protease [Xenorhabdus nematophila]CEF30139.1 putative protease protein [Xenorhabdus nematophila str. Websteri]AYA40554.1 protease [Xenorhabdus nematophila]MBA0019291.1 phage protease [Xenorhabdus nematophila]MCB4425590.1 protease [Xenorhabdus nematophila]QNJ38191.1 phage protease [Xenorhabdus nematophila]
MKTRIPTPKNRVAILSAAISDSPDGWYQLLPAGHFSARDGRPDDVPGGQWVMDATGAAQFIAATAAIGQPVLFDYNHVTLKQDSDAAACAEARAAGWLRDPRNDMQWREGVGLFVRLSLTPAAQAAVDNREWAYLSAVFPYDESGRPLYLRLGALTNDPGLTGMQSMAALSAQRDTLISPSPTTEDIPMNDMLLQLLEQLGIELPEDTTELTDDALSDLLTQALAALETLKASAQVALDAQEVIETLPDPDAISTEVTTLIDENAVDLTEAEQILEEAALNGVDLTRFVPARAYHLLARQAAVLNARASSGSADSIIASARRTGRVVAAEIPYLKAVARQHGIAALNAAISGRRGIGALTRRQTPQYRQPGKRLAVLSAADKEAARLQGLTDAEFLKRKQKGAKK